MLQRPELPPYDLGYWAGLDDVDVMVDAALKMIAQADSGAYTRGYCHGSYTRRVRQAGALRTKLEGLYVLVPPLQVEDGALSAVPEPIDVQARALAVRYHGDQKYGDEPYVVHLDAVADLAGPNRVYRAVAYLHDVLEDARAEDKQAVRDAINARFGENVLRCVENLTDEPGKNRAERKYRTNQKLGALSQYNVLDQIALTVKAADRLANVRQCVKTNDSRFEMYRREHPAFRAACSRTGLCDGLWRELEVLFVNGLKKPE